MQDFTKALLENVHVSKNQFAFEPIYDYLFYENTLGCCVFLDLFHFSFIFCVTALHSVTFRLICFQSIYTQKEQLKEIKILLTL